MSEINRELMHERLGAAIDRATVEGREPVGYTFAIVHIGQREGEHATIKVSHEVGALPKTGVALLGGVGILRQHVESLIETRLRRVVSDEAGGDEG